MRLGLRVELRLFRGMNWTTQSQRGSKRRFLDDLWRWMTNGDGRRTNGTSMWVRLFLSSFRYFSSEVVERCENIGGIILARFTQGTFTMWFVRLSCVEWRKEIKIEQERGCCRGYCIYISWNGLTAWKVLRNGCNHCFYLQGLSVFVCASFESIDSTFTRDFVL